MAYNPDLPRVAQEIEKAWGPVQSPDGGRAHHGLLRRWH
jgi:hypothetical protein